MALMIFFLLCTLLVVAKASNNDLTPGYDADAHLSTRTRAAPPPHDREVISAVPAGADALPLVVTPPDSQDHPQYSYSYGLRKIVNGAVKSHHETRNGHIVEGNYNILDSDGIIRTVNYAVDKSNGYNAIVHKKSPMIIMTSPMIDRTPTKWAVSIPAYPFDLRYMDNFPLYHLF